MNAHIRAVAIRVGPGYTTGAPTFEIELEDGRLVAIELDTAHANLIAKRLEETVNGRVSRRPPSRRVIELALSADRSR